MQDTLVISEATSTDNIDNVQQQGHAPVMNNQSGHSNAYQQATMLEVQQVK